MADFHEVAHQPDMKLEELFHGDLRREIQEALFAIPKTTFWRESLNAALRDGSTVVALDAEAPTRPATWEQLTGRKPPDGDITT